MILSAGVSGREGGEPQTGPDFESRVAVLVDYARSAMAAPPPRPLTITRLYYDNAATEVDSGCHQHLGRPGSTRIH